MREVSELLSKKELELSNLAKQVESVSKEIEALRTTLRLLEQAGPGRPAIQENGKRPTISLRTESGSRETAVAELP
jgi:hypothetical protein